MVNYGWVDPHDRDLLRRLALSRARNLLGICALLRSIYASDEERELLDRARDQIIEAKEVLHILFADIDTSTPRQEMIF